MPVNIDSRLQQLGLLDLVERDSDQVLEESETNQFPEVLGGVLDRIERLAQDDRTTYLEEITRHARERGAAIGLDVSVVDTDSPPDPNVCNLYEYAIAEAELPGGLGIRGRDLTPDQESGYAQRLHEAGRGYRTRAD